MRDLDRLEERVLTSAQFSLNRLRQLLSKDCGLSTLAALKFSTTGCDPLDHSKSLNLVEQLNQSFTYLASIAATRWLLEHHPEHIPFSLNLGTATGPDIVSRDGTIAAETFAATHPNSNRKLAKDVEKVRAHGSRRKYVFFPSPVAARRDSYDGVTIVRLTHTCLSESLAGEYY
jgi:hypothetical protein